MSINEVRSTIKDASVEIDIVVSGMTISVPESQVTWKGNGYTVEETEAEFTADQDEPTYVNGYLVYDTENSEMVVVVDEIVRGSDDDPFDFESSSYQEVTGLFSFVIPAAASSLEELEVSVFRLVLAAPTRRALPNTPVHEVAEEPASETEG